MIENKFRMQLLRHVVSRAVEGNERAIAKYGESWDDERRTKTLELFEKSKAFAERISTLEEADQSLMQDAMDAIYGSFAGQSNFVYADKSNVRGMDFALMHDYFTADFVAPGKFMVLSGLEDLHDISDMDGTEDDTLILAFSEEADDVFYQERWRKKSYESQLQFLEGRQIFKLPVWYSSYAGVCAELEELKEVEPKTKSIVYFE